MHELVVNLHMHTYYSDGHVSHADIVRAAIKAGLDVVIVTDHNLLVEGMEGYFQNGDRRVLLLVGEEIHDQARQPQKNHLLVFAADRELATLAWDPERLLDAVRQAGGLAFIAHPFDPAAPAVSEDDISWIDWEIRGYTGIEIWNAMSEFKSLLKSKLHGLFYAFNPARIARGPFSQTLQKWDELLTSGQRVVGVGGSDAHAFHARLGPIERILFPYEFHFRAINTHLLVRKPLMGELEADRKIILEALSRGRAFVGYDFPASTRGFRFTAKGLEDMAYMGDEISAQGGVTLQLRFPRPVESRLIRDGEIVQTWDRRETCTYITTQPGAYRVEAYLEFLGLRRGWIFSNPIYIRKKV